MAGSYEWPHCLDILLICFGPLSSLAAYMIDSTLAIVGIAIEVCLPMCAVRRLLYCQPNNTAYVVLASETAMTWSSVVSLGWQV
jgi:hypothetical protein